MAPQHPKNAVMNIIDPMAISNIGGKLKWYLSGIKDSIPVLFSFNRIPTVKSAKPAICAEKIQT